MTGEGGELIGTLLAVLAALAFSFTGILLLVVVLPWRLSFRCAGVYFECEDEEAPQPALEARLDLVWWLLELHAVRTGLWGPIRLDGSIAGIRFRMRLGRRRTKGRSASPHRKTGRKVPVRASGDLTKSSKPTPQSRRPRRFAPLTRAEVVTLVGAGIRLALRVWRIPRIRLDGDITFGFEDPATTGMVGAAVAAAGMPKSLVLRTDYERVGVSGWFAISARVRLYRLVAAVLRTAWIPEVRQIAIRRLKTAVGRTWRKVRR